MQSCQLDRPTRPSDPTYINGLEMIDQLDLWATKIEPDPISNGQWQIQDF